MATYKLIENSVLVNRITLEDPAHAGDWVVVLDDGLGAIGDPCDPATGVCTPPPVDPEQLKADCSSDIQTLLDTTAQAHGYDSLERCIGYRGDPVAFWDAEGTRAFAWRSECWSKGKEIQDAAAAGNWPHAGAGQLPTRAEVLAAMPPADWPVEAV